jgi:NhaA family Na+:H+ antiporter
VALVVLFPVAFATWALVHAAGIHATIAGVLLGMTVPVLYSERDRPAGHRHAPGGLAATVEHHLRPISAGIAVPLFAFFAAGVPIGGADGVGSALTDPVAIGIVVGLVVGKPVGIVATTWVVTRWTRAELDADLRWPDLVVVGTVAGIGFTVSLLVAQLTFGDGTSHGDHAKLAVLGASILASALAAVIVRTGGRPGRSSVAEPS